MQQSVDRGREDHELQCAAIYSKNNMQQSLYYTNLHSIVSTLYNPLQIQMRIFRLRKRGSRTNLIETGTY